MVVAWMIRGVRSVGGGWLAAPAFLPGGTDYCANFRQPVFGNVEVAGGEAEAHSLEIWLAAIAVAVALAGALFAYRLYLKRPEKADGLAKSLKPAYTTLLNKYYVDELYAATVVRPLLWISTKATVKAADRPGIDAASNR